MKIIEYQGSSNKNAVKNSIKNVIESESVIKFMVSKKLFDIDVLKDYCEEYIDDEYGENGKVILIDLSTLDSLFKEDGSLINEVNDLYSFIDENKFKRGKVVVIINMLGINKFNFQLNKEAHQLIDGNLIKDKELNKNKVTFIEVD